MDKNFTVRLAGKNIKISALHSFIKEYCKEYLTEDKPDFLIEVLQSDIDFERKKSADEGNFSDEYLETLAVYRKIAEQMLEYDTLLFHGSAVALDGTGYLFTARSGTGKSTHTRLWKEYFRERAVMVNDDKPLLQVRENGVFVYGTPWNGKHHISNNISVPLKAICILTRAENNHIEQITKSAIYPMLIQQAYRPANPDKMEKTLKLLDKISDRLSFYRLGCNMDIQAVRTAYDGMKG